MKEDTPPPLLKLDQAEGELFLPIDLEVTPGMGVIVHSIDDNALGEFIDVINALSPRTGGEVLFFGSDPAKLGDDARLELRRDAGYTTSGGGLISNLKIWENLVLPLHARGQASTPKEIEQLEEMLTEAFTEAGFDEAWLRANLHESTDRLSEFEKIICGLIRCHLAGFRLLICDCLFGGIDRSRAIRVAKMLDWLGAQHPNSAILLLHHGQAPDGAFGLSAWDPIENVSLEIR